MCGIAGFLTGATRWGNGAIPTVLGAMGDAIRHRGPDDKGAWFDADHGIGLAHRRLSIVDLSPGGHQPMAAADGRFVVVFNGEIYNHLDLRQDLEAVGCRFRSASDTEVLVEAIAHWGVFKTCERLLGMFAFAVWDRLEKRLTVARDRLGKKPLYVFHHEHGGIAFASELKALRHFPGFKAEINNQALSEYFRYSYIADHLCIFKDVEKVMHGTIIQFKLGELAQTQRYWSLAEVVKHGKSNRIYQEAEAEESLLYLLRDATQRRMLADVPIGGFLSGGVDSGLVVSLMQEANFKKVRTFSIGFREAAFDEAPVARAVARHLGTDHTELYVTDIDAQQVVPQLPDIFDEPFADASQIPTYLLAKLTRNQVTVALTGDGGDESFGGYPRYRNQHGLVGALCSMPRPMRSVLADTISAVPASAWEAAVGLMPSRRRPRFVASKIAKVIRAMRLDSDVERAKAYLSFWSPPDLITGYKSSPSDPFSAPLALDLEPSESMQFWETLHYLPGDLLTKVDRATMAASLEARSPLLDHRVVEMAWRLPPAMKASNRASKLILRSLLFRYVPRELVDLPKQGFSVPVGKWMTAGLRDWMEELFYYGRRNTGETLNWLMIDDAWRAHLAGRVGYSEKLWIVAMFCSWHQRWFASAGSRI
ncbi:asparagine synthase (glutamine-hydrolyzing) [Piscinibacter sakaiensis]|uniref:asparagine synthase (glutamine-hydrolyzing) n=1 Tax=Piscinibacter sakaiensis TaxID=1547922 RepID=UPI003AAEEA50